MSASNPSRVQLSPARLGELATTLDRLAEDPAAEAATRSIRERLGLGSSFLGWLDLPHRRDEEHRRLLGCAERLRGEIDTLIVVGIGGSYLGARAIIEAMQWKLRHEGGPRVVYAGHHLEAHALAAILDEVDGHEVAVNVISKSGTTTEPAIAFRLLRLKLEEVYGVEMARSRIVATTDRDRGALRTLTAEEGYESFVVPGDVGGRFSVLSPVGLLPMAVAGVDCSSLLDGAAAEAESCMSLPFAEVGAVQYAALRQALYLGGVNVEVLASFHPSLHSLAEWWKQLFGESEGKQGRGLWPASVDYTTDLHSLGQYMQAGRRILTETFLHVLDPPPGPQVPNDVKNLDGLNYLADREIAGVNQIALEAVADAHLEGGVLNQTLSIADLSEESLGALLFFFEFAVAISGRLLGVNPFDQPGVEAYKIKLFERLGRPGSV